MGPVGDFLDINLLFVCFSGVVGTPQKFNIYKNGHI